MLPLEDQSTMHWANWWDWPSHQIAFRYNPTVRYRGPLVNVILSYVIFVSRLAQLPLSKGWDCCLSSPVSIMVVPSLANTCLSQSTPLHLRHRLLPSDPLLILPPELTMKFLSFLLIFVHLGPRSDPGPSCHSPPCSDPESRGYLQ